MGIARYLAPIMAAALACATASAARAGSQDFTLVNRTGYPITSIYVTEVGNLSWGNDVMARDTLFAGESVRVSFDRDTAVCRWNVLVKYRDDTRAVWNDLDLCSLTRFSLFWDPRTLETVARAE